MRYQPTLIQLKRAEGVDYDGQATVKLQSGITYSIIEIETNLVNRSTLKKITIDLNGSEIWYASGTELDTLDQILGKFRESGRFVIDLADFGYRSMAGIRQKELVTKITDDVTLKCEFGAAGTGDPATLTMKAKAWAINNQTDQYFLPQRLRVTQNLAAAGVHEMIYPNSDPSRYIQRMLFDESNATISKLEVYRGATRIFEGDRSDIEFAQKRHSVKGYSPVAGYLLFDPTLFGFGSNNALNTGQRDSLTFKLTVDSPGAMQVLIDGFEQVRAVPVANA